MSDNGENVKDVADIGGSQEVPSVELSDDAAEVINVTDVKEEGGDVASKATDKKLLKIMKQVEYYFSDINLPRDRFIQGELKNNNGWMNIEVLLKFNRLAAISTDITEITKALENSELIEVSEDKKKIRRNPNEELPENNVEYWADVHDRTAYVRGIPLGATLDDMLEFSKKFGEVENVAMRRYSKTDRRFKGSVFITYKDRETAQAFVDNDVEEFKNSAIFKMMQTEYWAKRSQKAKDKKQAAKTAKDAKNTEDKEQKLPHFVKGLIIKVTNLPDDCDLKAIKEFFGEYGTIGFVTIDSLANNETLIRFTGPEGSALAAWEAAKAAGTEGKVIFDGNELSASVLEGDDENKYWDDFAKDMENKVKRDSGRKGARGARRGGRGNSRGRGGTRRGGARGQKRSLDDNKDPTNEGSLAKKFSTDPATDD